MLFFEDGLRCNERLAKTDDNVLEDCVKEWLRHAGDRLKTENKNRNGYQDVFELINVLFFLLYYFLSY